MSSVNKDLKTYFGRCRCCLHYGYLKSMWKTYHCNGDDEVYGKMLTECYALSWQNPESVEHDQICELCVQKLRDAYDFKKLVIRSQKQLMLDIVNDTSVEQYKEEFIKTEELSTGKLELINEEDYVENVQDVSNLDREDHERETVFFENIEYLEEEMVSDNNKQEDKPKERIPSESEESECRTSRKPKRRPPAKRYFQYTADDMLEAVAAVRSNKMTRLEASQYFKVPRKTLAIRVKDETEMAEKDPTQQQMTKFLKEIKTILTYTNATPYKIKGTRYACMYCQEVFEEPVDLRNHTRTVHMDDRTKKLDIAMRPHWMNEIIKVDIHNLLCVVCCVLINDWNSMLKHLKEEHQVSLDQAYNRVIPYSLDADLKCILCEQQFINYVQLDSHMNMHYYNYVCLHCGDTFLAETRLKKHVTIHSADKWPCAFCSKFFNTHNNVKKHENIVHKSGSYFRCRYCKERFLSDKLKKEHITKVHSDNVRLLTCELCGKTFDWKRSYIEHMKIHSGKKWTCQFCEKTFNTHSNLIKHEKIVHKRSSYFRCSYCDERFHSDSLKKKHLLEMHSEKLALITCELCSKTFNWRQDYLRHTKTAHGK